MTRTRLTSLVASSLLVLVLGQNVDAQVPGPLPPPGSRPTQSGPTFSPYLNLLRRGTNPALNYYGLVRPELQWRSSVRQLSQEIDETQAEIGAAQGGAALQTGHPVHFLNLSHFYPASGRGAGTPAAPAGGARSSRSR